MKYGFASLDCLRAKFYQREPGSKNFLEMSEEQLSVLAKKVYEKEETMVCTLPQMSEKTVKLERYRRTLLYLTNSYINLELKTFDERVAFLIMMTDSNLVTFREFLKIDLISMADINKIENEKERDYLTNIRNQTLSIFESRVREKIGFYDVKLLKYEEMFFRRFFNDKELITEVENNNYDNLVFKSKFLKDFNEISDEKYEELTLVANTWLSLIPSQFNYKVAAYSVINQKKLLGLTNLAEQLTLFILLIDNNLDILKIYEEESILKNIESRIIEQFGFFNKELVVLERKFYDRFCPDKILSVWTKRKKQ